MQKKTNKANVRVLLLAYDTVILMLSYLLLLIFYHGEKNVSYLGVLEQFCLSFVCVLATRFIGKIYRQIWRYGGIQCYIRLIMTDVCAFLVNVAIEHVLPIERITFPRLLSVLCLNLLGALTIRMLYRYAYKCGSRQGNFGKLVRLFYRVFSGNRFHSGEKNPIRKIKIAIVGAGRVGVSLAEELLNNPNAAYLPRCFIDTQPEKIGKDIFGIPVIAEGENAVRELPKHEIQEVVFAISDLPDEQMKLLCERYLNAGFKIKSYDFPAIQGIGSKRQLREFDVEDLLFRKPIVLNNEKTVAYYRDKVVLITGGGGSIGSELCRQIAKKNPRQIVILDIYENGAYDIQQELRMMYGKQLDVRIEIVSITNRAGMHRVFEAYHPDIVINAAAHKHVPLMEHNCIEAVENNVFGTKNLVDLCEEFGTARFMMVSTDKAVNPTNVMGATKRMCEMIVLGTSSFGKTKYSATRFGNVLGSAGSVIPLFKRQIASGGPITLTDKRIIRYFMTIPEASQLVLESGAMAHNGELFVLDMGQPVRIYDLAQSMIRLSGASGIEIVETGLREGEKLYEELLIKTEDLDKTENSLIFIEKEQLCSREEIESKLSILQEACATGDDEVVRAALKQVVPTYRSPEEVNRFAEQAEEMKKQASL